MDFSKLLPKSNERKQDNELDDLLYLCLVEWKWPYDHFINTPIPVLRRLLKKHAEVVKKQNKKK